MKKIIRLLVLVILGTSLLEGSVGKITAINGKATLERASSSVSAALGSSLEAKDTIVTTKEAKAQLTFNDNTIITVGKQSTFSVEEYLFDATPSSTTKFTMLNGTIRVLSGKIGKIAPEKFALKTKTATIGIRGTDFIAHVSPQGEGPIFCMQGSISVRTHDNNESNLTSQLRIVPAGSFVNVSSTGSVSDVKEFTATQLNTVLMQEFTIPSVVPVDGNIQHETNTVIKFSTDTSIPMLHPDETLNRGSAVGIDTLVTDSIIENITLPADTSPPPSDSGAFSGFSSMIYQQPIYVETSLGSGIFDVIGNQVFTGKGTLTLSSIPSSSSVSGSIMMNDTTGNPLWTIGLGSTITYNALDSFSTSIASYSWVNTTYTADPISAYALASLTTTADVSEDFFSWGEWTIDPMIFSTTTGIETDQFSTHGYWAAGSETPASTLNAFRSASTSMTYSGNVIGEVQTVNENEYNVNTSPITTGSIAVNVNFETDTFQSNLVFQTDNTNNYTLTYNGSTVTNHLSGSLSGGSLSSSTTGSLQGGFYGSTGKITGGTFDASSASDLLKIQGAFKAVAP